MWRRLIYTNAVLALCCALAMMVASPRARADVLVEHPGTSVACGDSIKLGVWYQSYSGGPRNATIEVLSARKLVLMRKHVTAATTWRYWYYTPRCGRHYYVRYTVPAGRETYRIWIPAG
jgi:hypothetical protein